MERTETKDNIIYIGDLEFKGLLTQVVRVHAFTHSGEKPAKIVIPILTEVDGVPIEFMESAPVPVTEPVTVTLSPDSGTVDENVGTTPDTDNQLLAMDKAKEVFTNAVGS